MIGKQVGRYKIHEALGQGGMGVVYKAHDPKLDRTIAIKFLASDLTSNEEARRRFIHEARAASGLDHPNICTIHDIGETEDGQTFIAASRQDLRVEPLLIINFFPAARSISELQLRVNGKNIVVD